MLRGPRLDCGAWSCGSPAPTLSHYCRGYPGPYGTTVWCPLWWQLQEDSLLCSQRCQCDGAPNLEPLPGGPQAGGAVALPLAAYPGPCSHTHPPRGSSLPRAIFRPKPDLEITVQNRAPCAPFSPQPWAVSSGLSSIASQCFPRKAPQSELGYFEGLHEILKKHTLILLFNHGMCDQHFYIL